MTSRVREPGILAKTPTGIVGLDAMLEGGIPKGRITLIQGSSGAGKTVLALQSLVHGASSLDEPGIFVAFEEQSERIRVNAASFQWPPLWGRKVFFLDAQPPAAALQSGTFDLGGMLAALDGLLARTKARRIVFDAIDVVLTLLEDPAAERRELYRLRDWIHSRKVTVLLTSKKSEAGLLNARTEFIQFMVDCSLCLENRVEGGVAQRSLRISKYRGTAFQENEAPYVIGAPGIDVAVLPDRRNSLAQITNERLSSGSERLDTMLGGGYHRGAGILLTGAPGTSKSTLACAFADAACRRGERVLFITFDSAVPEMVRNMRSVGMRLDKHLPGGRGSGLLRMELAQSLLGNAESQLSTIQAMAHAHKAQCLIIDPLSALTRGGNEDLVESVVSRLIDWSKFNGTTLLCTSLLGEVPAIIEKSPLRISTLADTWLHVSYVIRGGERNRALTIVKSRGTAHSNQVRELILGDDGITLADAYTAGGEVLMGTLRWERELSEEATRRLLEKDELLRLQQLSSEHARLSAQMMALKALLDTKSEQLTLLRDTQSQRRTETVLHRTDMSRRRSADAGTARARTRSR